MYFSSCKHQLRCAVAKQGVVELTKIDDTPKSEHLFPVSITTSHRLT
jgi:hypothetical protein